jgi:hypothetical protein
MQLYAQSRRVDRRARPSRSRVALRSVVAQLSVKIRPALNRAFAQWGEVFPNAACVVSLVDRFTHRAEVVRIDGMYLHVYVPRPRRSWPTSNGS